MSDPVSRKLTAVSAISNRRSSEGFVIERLRVGVARDRGARSATIDTDHDGPSIRATPMVESAMP
jgi:hypothetical protein